MVQVSYVCVPLFNWVYFCDMLKLSIRDGF